MANILILEDDRELNASVSTFLTMKRHEIKSCLDAETALDALYENRFDIIICDVLMKGMDGFEFTEEVRKINSEIPIMLMTALDDISSKTKGFRLGIDDYMVKPVDLEELNLRISALLKRAGIKSEKKIAIGDFILDREEYTAYWKEDEIPLTKREFQLLYKLLSNPKKTYTRTQLLDECWSWDSSAGPRSVDVYITKLRTKLSACTSFEIQTVHGLGYKAVMK
ncbi:MAG: response regulator transcription factor [Bullifex sp.]